MIITLMEVSKGNYESEVFRALKARYWYFVYIRAIINNLRADDTYFSRLHVAHIENISGW